MSNLVFLYQFCLRRGSPQGAYTRNYQKSSTMNDTTHNKGAGHSRAKNGSKGSIHFPQSSITKKSTKKRRGGATKTGVSQMDMQLGNTNNERKS